MAKSRLREEIEVLEMQVLRTERGRHYPHATLPVLYCKHDLLAITGQFYKGGYLVMYVNTELVWPQGFQPSFHSGMHTLVIY